MAIGDVSSIALSALRLSAEQLAVSAGNVANANTDGYEAQRLLAQEAPDGGVTGVVVPTGDPAPIVIRDNTEVALSNTDLATEQIAQISAQRAFEANLAMVRADQEMQAALVDTIDGIDD